VPRTVEHHNAHVLHAPCTHIWPHHTAINIWGLLMYKPTTHRCAVIWQ
jgi:hypothetical protein